MPVTINHDIMVLGPARSLALARHSLMGSSRKLSLSLENRAAQSKTRLENIRSTLSPVSGPGVSQIMARFAALSLAARTAERSEVGSSLSGLSLDLLLQ